MVWQIGQPDRNCAEFAITGNYQAFPGWFDARPLVFEVGRSKAASDWPFIQPGLEDAWAGSRVHPFTIRFPLAEEPRGVFTLRVEFVDVHAGERPAFVVTVGRRRAQFRLQPGNSDASLRNSSTGKPQKIELALPAGLFRRGANDIVLSAAAGSWVLYDAITLLNDPQAKPAEPDIRSLTAEPTPFFVEQDGRLRRVLNVKLTTTSLGADVALSVQAGGETNVVPLKAPIWFAGLSQDTSVSRSASQGSSPSRTQVFRLSQEIGAPDLEVGVPDSQESFEATLTARVGTSVRSTTVKVEPQVKWKLFVAPNSHTDIGYTDLQPKCAERHNENLDLALDLMEKFPDFKWNLEVAWQAENYLAVRPAEQREKFLRFAREGRLGIEGLYLNILTGLCSHEAGCRLLSYVQSLRGRYGISCRSAMISDVPTQEASLPMLLAGGGIRYLSVGINHERAYPFTAMETNSPCWWEGPDGSRVLTMFAAHYAQASKWGLTRSVDAARVNLLRLPQDYQAAGHLPLDALWFHGAYIDNERLTPKLAEVAQAWNRHYAFPKIILCRSDEYFEYVEKRFGDKLPVVRGSGGAYWEDGAASSARETALCRNAQGSLASAETLLSLAHRVRPIPAGYPNDALNSAWRNCLFFDEHIWGAANSINDPDEESSRQQWNYKAQFAVQADAESRSLLDQGTAAWAALVQTDGRSLVVINSASWPRSDIVRFKLPAGTGVLAPDVPACDTPEGTLLLVKDVPACGYRTLKLGRQSAPQLSQPAEGTILESTFYRVTFDPVSGAITGLFDKKLGRELVDPRAPYALNQYLYVAGGEGSRIIGGEQAPEPKLSVSVPNKAVLRRFRLGSLGERMIVETSAAMTPRLVTEVTVWNDLPRVDIVNRVTKTQTYDKEAVYFAFPFAAGKPVFRYECPAGIVSANNDMLPGACLEWFAVQHFVEVETGDAAIALATPDAPMVCFHDFNHGRWPRRLPFNNGHVYAYVMNNYWYTNYRPGQGGDHVFRFSITSRAKAGSIALARFGWAASNPLLAVAAEGEPGAPLPAGSASLVEIEEPNVLLLGAKQPTAGNALVLRLWEVAGQPCTAHVRLKHLPAGKATLCNLVEEPQRALEIKDNVVTVPLRGSGLATVRIE